MKYLMAAAILLTVSAFLSGCPYPDTDLAGIWYVADGSTWTFTARYFEILETRENGKVLYGGTYSVDTEKDPRYIDLRYKTFTVVEGDAGDEEDTFNNTLKGRTVLGIYRAEGEDMVFMLGEADGERPSAFGDDAVILLRDMEGDNFSGEGEGESEGEGEGEGEGESEGDPELNGYWVDEDSMYWDFDDGALYVSKTVSVLGLVSTAAYTAEYTVDTSADPRTIDVLYVSLETEGFIPASELEELEGRVGETAPGVYGFEGDTLLLNMGEAGEARPADLEGASVLVPVG